MQTAFTAHFDRAQYRIGEQIRLLLPPETEVVSVQLCRLGTEIPVTPLRTAEGLVLDALPAGGYGLLLHTSLGTWEGAFDVADPHRREVRYGFLSDFALQDADTADVEWMRDLHLNAIQFYDWMYRHDQLLPPTEEYEDPMGRQTALAALREKIEACKRSAIRPFAYGAVYAATKKTFREHPEWAMYTMDGRPMTFADWLYFMNVSSDCGWTEHIVDEYRNAVRFGFSGIHMDTYGFPKHVWAHDGSAVELGMTNFPFTDERQLRDIESINLLHEAAAQGNRAWAWNGILHKGRDNARTPMQWDAAPSAGFTSGSAWIEPNPNARIINAASEYADKNSVLHFYRTLIALRNASDVLKWGDFQLLLPEHPQIFAYRRTFDGKFFEIWCNFSKESCPLPDGIAGTPVLACGVDNSVFVPYGFLITASE